MSTSATKSKQAGISSQKVINDQEIEDQENYKSPIMSPFKQLNLSRVSCLQAVQNSQNTQQGHSDAKRQLSFNSNQKQLKRENQDFTQNYSNSGLNFESKDSND